MTIDFMILASLALVLLCAGIVMKPSMERTGMRYFGFAFLLGAILTTLLLP